ncbi:MAG: hypothetical protein LCH53_14055 [Bacteroidetes bacterium]|nr:hypothetical protein [Bacteroidota bacterium]
MSTIDLFETALPPTSSQVSVLDFAHPLPRYGAAVALYLAKKQPQDATTVKDAIPLVRDALGRALASFSLRTFDQPTDASLDKLRFQYVPVSELAPGPAAKQNAANGCYMAPHVLSSDVGAAGTVAEARALLKALDEAKAATASAQFKRSISPVTAKGNWGRSSLADPKASLLMVACTALGTLAALKPAAWRGKEGNVGLIPDLPLVQGDTSPLLAFIKAFDDLTSYAEGQFEAALDPKGKASARKYKRPKIFRGNYPEAAQGLGAVSLVAALGRVAREERIHATGDSARAERARSVLASLAEQPLYLISNAGTQQERFGHHLVRLAEEHDLADVLKRMQGLPTGASGFNDPKVSLYRTMFDRWLRFFTLPAFRDFLAIRADYPSELAPILSAFFTSSTMELSEEIVASARAYGAFINRAAYYAAKESVDDDKRSERTGLTPAEYKQRFLVTFESFVRSAKTGPALLASVGREVGRFSKRDLPTEAAPFMEAVARGDVPVSVAQDLMMAFMRVSTFQKNEGTPADEAEDDIETTGDDDTPSMD